MRKLLIFFFFAASSLSFGEEKSFCLKAIVLLGPQEPLLKKEEKKGLKGVDVLGYEMSSLAKLEKQLALYFREKEITWNDIQDIKQSINAFFAEEQGPFTWVILPHQKVEYGVLQFQIKQSTIGQIEISGNCWSRSSYLLSQLDLEEGDPINAKEIDKKIGRVNKNPFQKVTLILSPGEKEATSDLLFLVQDRVPFSVYLGSDNTGVESIGTVRLFGGFTIGDLWWKNQTFTAQYTTSTYFHRFQAFTGQYLGVMPWGMISLYGGYSTVEPRATIPSEETKGKNGQASFRYLYPWEQGQTLSVGADYKITNNDVEYVEIQPLISKIVTITQLNLTYEKVTSFKEAQLTLKGELYYSPGEWLPHQSNADYSFLKPGAVNHWVYVKMGLGYSKTFFDTFVIDLVGRLQLSSQILLPMEELGIGGYDTVRGYEERQLNFSNGGIINLELLTPPTSFLARWWRKYPPDQIQLLVFTDYGYGWENQSVEGLQKHNYLWGVGPGFRYEIPPFLTLYVEWGVKLHREAIFGEDWSRTHFSVIGQF